MSCGVVILAIVTGCTDIMSQESVTTTHRKSPLSKTASTQAKKASVPAVLESSFSPTNFESKRKTRRAFSLEIQLEEDLAMDSKKGRTVAFEELLIKALNHFGRCGVCVVIIAVVLVRFWGPWCMCSELVMLLCHKISPC